MVLLVLSQIACNLNPCPVGQYLDDDGLCHSPDQSTDTRDDPGEAAQDDSAVEHTDDSGHAEGHEHGAPEDENMEATSDTSYLDPFEGDVGGSSLECIQYPTPGTLVTQGQHLSSKAIDINCSIGEELESPFPVAAEVIEVETSWSDRYCYDTVEQYNTYCSDWNACNNYIKLQTTIAGVTWTANLLHIDDSELRVGDAVDAFERVGTCGNIGWTCPVSADGSHLHLTLFNATNGNYTYPGDLLDESCEVIEPVGSGDSCTDLDGDGYGVGVDCRGSDCDDTEASVHEDGTERADYLDNDCDGDTDEGFRVELERIYWSNGMAETNPAADWDHCLSDGSSSCAGSGQGGDSSYVADGVSFFVYDAGLGSGDELEVGDYTMAALHSCFHDGVNEHWYGPYDAKAYSKLAATSGWTCTSSPIGYVRTGYAISDAEQIDIRQHYKADPLSDRMYSETVNEGSSLGFTDEGVAFYAWSR